MNAADLQHFLKSLPPHAYAVGRERVSLVAFDNRASADCFLKALTPAWAMPAFCPEPCLVLLTDYLDECYVSAVDGWESRHKEYDFLGARFAVVLDHLFSEFKTELPGLYDQMPLWVRRSTFGPDRDRAEELCRAEVATRPLSALGLEPAYWSSQAVSAAVAAGYGMLVPITAISSEVEAAQLIRAGNYYAFQSLHLSSNLILKELISEVGGQIPISSSSVWKAIEAKRLIWDNHTELIERLRVFPVLHRSKVLDSIRFKDPFDYLCQASKVLPRHLWLKQVVRYQAELREAQGGVVSPSLAKLEEILSGSQSPIYLLLPSQVMREESLVSIASLRPPAPPPPEWCTPRVIDAYLRAEGSLDDLQLTDLARSSVASSTAPIPLPGSAEWVSVKGVLDRVDFSRQCNPSGLTDDWIEKVSSHLIRNPAAFLAACSSKSSWVGPVIRHSFMKEGPAGRDVVKSIPVKTMVDLVLHTPSLLETLPVRVLTERVLDHVVAAQGNLLKRLPRPPTQRQQDIVNGLLSPDALIESPVIAPSSQSEEFSF